MEKKRRESSEIGNQCTNIYIIFLKEKKKSHNNVYYQFVVELPCRPATFVNVHDLLLSTCDTLTDLTIHSGVGNTLLDTILDHCPNLVSFQYLLSGSFYNFARQQPQNNNTKRALKTKLRRLILDIPLNEQKVLSILSSCPNLSQLQLRSSDMRFGYFDAILMYIHQYHSKLEYLRLFGTSTRHASSLSYPTCFPPLSLSSPSPSSLTQPQHLRELWLIGTDEGSSTHIIPFIYQHHTTLTSLHIRSPITPNCMYHLASFSYPALEELYIQLTHYSPLANDLCTFIRHAPHLIRISLSSFTSTNTVSDQILDVLPSSIQQFKLQQGYNNIVHHDIITSEALIRFLKRSISIQEFYLPTVQAFNNNCLDLLSSIHKESLTTLDLYGNEQITDNGLQRFVDNISSSNNDSNKNNNSKKLQLLNLGQCTLITPNMINYVKNRLPYIKIYN